MSTITVTTGYSCNNRCLFCAQGDLRSQQQDASSEEIRRVLQQRIRPGATVVLSGGEIGLRPEVADWISVAKTLGADQVWLRTNGRMAAYSQWLKRLMNKGLSGLEVQLLGADAACHDYLTNCAGSWTQTLTGIRRAQALGLAVAIRTVLTRSNFRHLGEMAALLPRVGVRRWWIINPTLVGNAGRVAGSLAPRIELLAPVVNRAAARFRGLGGQVILRGLPLCGGARWAEWAESPENIHVGPLAAADDLGQRAYAASCAACRLRSQCPGLDSVYGDMYGFGELVLQT